MTDQKISYKRLKDLERAEAKLRALEAGGVGNWDGYDFALEYIRKDMEIEEKREALLDDLMAELGTGAYEPAGSGCGIGFADDATNKAMAVLGTYKVTFKDLEGEEGKAPQANLVPIVKRMKALLFRLNSEFINQGSAHGSEYGAIMNELDRLGICDG